MGNTNIVKLLLDTKKFDVNEIIILENKNFFYIVFK